MASPEEYAEQERRDLIKKRTEGMTAKNLEKLFNIMASHLESCTFTPEQFWKAEYMITQIDYILDGNEVKKGNKDEVRSDNTGATGDREDDNSFKHS
tara:strand:- start:362 stop:652 length:291 start_codon:yes stop_codon:yes gene_type:complete